MQFGLSFLEVFSPVLVVTDPFNAEAKLFFSTTFAFWKFAVIYECSHQTLITAT
jgi:hypothetical protein